MIAAHNRRQALLATVRQYASFVVTPAELQTLRNLVTVTASHVAGVLSVALALALAPYRDWRLQCQQRELEPISREAHMWDGRLTGEASMAVKLYWTRRAKQCDDWRAHLQSQRDALPSAWKLISQAF